MRSKERNAKQASKRGDAKGSVWISGLKTVSRTPEASSVVLEESNSGIEDPSTESPLAMQEPLPSSISLGSNRSAVIFRDTNSDEADTAINCQSPPEPEHRPSSNKLSNSESRPLASSM
jgi:hypothetical protein